MTTRSKLTLVTASVVALLGPSVTQATNTQVRLEPTIAFPSTRDNPTLEPAINKAEIYLMDPGGNVRRLTENAFGDGFPVLSPDGKRIAFDSNRLRVDPEPLNTTDLFVMKADGTNQTHLLRGGSASWSPDGKRVAFHRSASGTGLPATTQAGSATIDSDIFVLDLDDFLEGRAGTTNITNRVGTIDDDPDWSSLDKIAFTSHLDTEASTNPKSAEIYTVNPDGTGLEQLTDNDFEERSPEWSPDGTRLVFSCRIEPPPNDRLQICTMNADGTDMTQLTFDPIGVNRADLAPSWSPDGTRIVWQCQPGPRNALCVMNADGTDETVITDDPSPGSFTPQWGVLRITPAQN